MKITIDNLDATYKLCISTGNIKEKTTDIELIKSLKILAEKSIEFIDKKSKDIPEDSTDWTFVSEIITSHSEDCWPISF